MNLVHRLTLTALLLLCLCPASSTAQETGTTPQPVEDSEPRIETKFDKDKNETKVGFDKMLIFGTVAEKLLISVQATYATSSPQKPPEDLIFIISTLNYTGYRYPNTNTLTITADGKDLPPIVLLNLDKRSGKDFFVETLGTKMKYDVYMKLAKAKNVRMQFSETSFTLTHDHLVMLGKLADLLHL